MRVPLRVAARAVLDEHTLDALAGAVRQLVMVDEGHLDVLRLRRFREDAAERQGGEKQQAEDAFHEDMPFGCLNAQPCRLPLWCATRSSMLQRNRCHCVSSSAAAQSAK